MSIVQEIAAAWKVRSIGMNVIKEIKTMNQASTKPFYKTTEFWGNLAVQGGMLWSAIQGFVPSKYAAIISSAGMAVYTICRTVAKAIADIQAARVIAAPVTAVATATAS